MDTIKMIDTQQKFANSVYQDFMSKRFGITTSCEGDIESSYIKKQLCDWQQEEIKVPEILSITSEIFNPTPKVFSGNGYTIDSCSDSNAPDWCRNCSVTQDENLMKSIIDAQAQVTKVEADLAVEQEDLAGLLGQLAKLQSDLDVIQSDINTLLASIDVLTQEINNLTNQRDSIFAQIDQLENDFDSTCDVASPPEPYCSNLTLQIQDLDAQAKALDEQITDKQNQLGDQQTQLADLYEAKENKIEQIAVINVQIQQQEEEIAETETYLAEDKAILAALIAQICINDAECVTFEVVDSNCVPVKDFELYIDRVGKVLTNSLGQYIHTFENASLETEHSLQLCYCFTTVGNCRQQKITLKIQAAEIETCKEPVPCNTIEIAETTCPEEECTTKCLNIVDCFTANQFGLFVSMGDLQLSSVTDYINLYQTSNPTAYAQMMESYECITDANYCPVGICYYTAYCYDIMQESLTSIKEQEVQNCIQVANNNEAEQVATFENTKKDLQECIEAQEQAQDEIDKINEEIEDLQAQLAVATDALGTIQSQINALEASIETLTQEINNLIQQADALTIQIDELEAQVTGLINDFDTICDVANPPEPFCSNLALQIQNLNDQIEALDDQKNVILETITNKVQQRANQEEDLNSLETNKTTIEGEIAQIETEIQSEQAKLTQAQAELAELIESCGGNITQLQQQIIDITLIRDIVNKGYQRIKAWLEDLEASLDKLIDKLDSTRKGNVNYTCCDIFPIICGNTTITFTGCEGDEATLPLGAVNRKVYYKEGTTITFNNPDYSTTGSLTFNEFANQIFTWDDECVSSSCSNDPNPPYGSNQA